jgi:hypothetical protein
LRIFGNIFMPKYGNGSLEDGQSVDDGRKTV